MDSSKIVVAPKMSKYEWDMCRFELTARQVIAKYKKEGVNPEPILASHERQRESLNLIKALFKKASFLSRNQLSLKRLSNAKMVVVLGGDNHFQYVSHFVRRSLVVGINSDPVRSDGSLTPFDPESFQRMFPSLEAGRHQVQFWTRIRVVLNERPLPSLALSEVFLGESHRMNMSRHKVSFKKKVEVQKCSGLLIATGSGSSGWYDSAGRYLFPKGKRFPKAEKILKFLVTEPFHGRLSRCSLLHGDIRKNEEIKIVSRNDAGGVLIVDSQEEHPFREGSVASLKIGLPLKVLVPN